MKLVYTVIVICLLSVGIGLPFWLTPPVEVAPTLAPSSDSFPNPSPDPDPAIISVPISVLVSPAPLPAAPMPEDEPQVPQEEPTPVRGDLSAPIAPMPALATPEPTAQPAAQPTARPVYCKPPTRYRWFRRSRCR